MTGWRKRQVLELAERASQSKQDWWKDDDALEAFAKLVRADEREVINDEWHSCVYSDLEHGVKCLNEQAAKDWVKNYPEIAKFGAWLEARGQA
jgi:hypothetical protein